MNEVKVKVKWEDLVKKFSPSVGREKAEQLVEGGVRESKVGKKNVYDKEEVLEIAESIKNLDDSTTYVNIAANTLKTKLRTNNSLD